MAKLVAVCRDDEFPFERRQIPLMIEDTLTMVMEIPETVISAECVSSTDVSQFIKRHDCLTDSEMNAALMVGQKELFALLAVSVPCVGCRRSVERLYNQLWESGQPAIEPLIIAASGVLTLSESFLVDAKLIYALFYIHGSHLNDIVDTIPKSRRNRRCILHSLETHKARASGSWMDVWDLLSQECRDEVVLIDSDSLLDTLENYLRKHRFCSECKSKVLRAYSILAGDIDGDTEKGYCAGLYEGLKSCPKERHVHVVCDTDFIAHLIGRAEPELAGGRRERHARTIDIAQEEVLTCLGIHLWERLHRLWQKLRAEEQTWQMLFYLGVEALRKSFETAVEEKQGISQLELVVEEISEAERAIEQRKENKRMKKKKRKENKAKLNEEKQLQQEEEEKTAMDEQDEEKCSEVTVDDVDSIADSEKSSSGSQVSPRKLDELLESSSTSSEVHTDDQVSLQNSQSSSYASSLDDKTTGLLKCLNDAPSSHHEDYDDNDDEVPPDHTCADEKENLSKCNGNSSSTESHHNKEEVSSCKTSPRYSCQTKDTSNIPDTSWKVCSETKKNSEWKQQQRSADHCKCDTPTSNKPNKRNGYTHHQEYSRTPYKSSSYNNKVNGHTDCSSNTRGCGNVGPRFHRHEQEQGRWKGGDHNEYHYKDVYDKVHSMNGALHHHGRGNGGGSNGGVGGGRGGKQRKGHPNKQQQWHNHSSDSHTHHHNDSSSSLLHHHHHHHYNDGSGNGVAPSLSPHHQRRSQQSGHDVQDEDELRLLKMMGWNSEDSHGISEQEIQEFTANRPEVQTRREELRDKLREQFNNLCINKQIVT